MKIGRGETNHLYVDVDGTLLMWRPPLRVGAPDQAHRDNLSNFVHGRVFTAALLPDINQALVKRLKAWHVASGGTLVVWSMGGTQHAENAATICDFGLDRVICIGKPDLAVDDNPHVWGKGAPVVIAPDQEIA